MNVLSLFDGISGAREALNRLGIKCNYYASEVDKYAIKIAQANYPTTIQLGDVSRIRAKDLPKIDLLVGGSPCQDLSIARADRQGLEGVKSGLFWEYIRLLRELKPEYFLLENVYSMGKADRDIISKEMGCSPMMINSSLLTAQNRKRNYWHNTGVWLQPFDMGVKLVDIIEDEAECTAIYTIPMGFNAGGVKITDKSPTITSGAFRYNNLLMVNPVRGCALRTRGVKKGPGVSRGKKLELRRDFKANALTRASTDSMVYNYKYDAMRKFTVLECERLQGFPDGYCSESGVSKTQCYNSLGNSYTVPIIMHLLMGIFNNN